MAWQVPKRAQPLFDFSVQVLFGALAFVAVLLIAVCIALVVKGINAMGVAPRWLIESADIAERVIWYVDLFALGLFLLGEILTLGRRMWKEWSEPHE